ncbi:unnamed protein product [Parnassius apollo]|uniref:(apollo) hypothetical protein n=1 Tax=Parnassius apollo TaxID=110799 RepID=A0A8S3X7F2_PARAO|nr:unnamed protein product [Parnassius apollo]
MNSYSATNNTSGTEAKIFVKSRTTLAYVLRGADDNTFVSLRKRKQSDDKNVKAVLEFVEQKINDQLSSWKLQLDITIAESIRNSIDTVIDRELKKISATISNSFKELGDRLDTIDKSLSYTIERQDSIETRLTQVESQLRSNDDVTSQINLLKDKIDAMEQQSRLLTYQNDVMKTFYLLLKRLVVSSNTL